MKTSRSEVRSVSVVPILFFASIILGSTAIASIAQLSSSSALQNTFQSNTSVPTANVTLSFESSNLTVAAGDSANNVLLIRNRGTNPFMITACAFFYKVSGSGSYQKGTCTWISPTRVKSGSSLRGVWTTTFNSASPVRTFDAKVILQGSAPGGILEQSHAGRYSVNVT